MPEDAIATPPAAPTGAMSHDSNPSAPTGIERMLAQLDTAHTTGRNIPEAKPDAAPTTPAPIPAAKTEPAKPLDGKPAAPAQPAAAKPETKPDAKPQQAAGMIDPSKINWKEFDWKSANVDWDKVDWSKAPDKWHKIYEGYKHSTGEKIRELEGKRKALEAKPNPTAADDKKLEAYEKQLAEIRDEATSYKNQLAAKDYYSTDDYKHNYQEPANRIYVDAVNQMKRMRVTDGDNQRMATQEDFDDIRSKAGKARRQLATEMFGEENASDVLEWAKDIDSYQLRSKIAAERHAQAHEKTALEREGKTKQEKQQYDDHYRSALDGMKANEQWGKWFSDDETDPEGTKIYNEGLSEIDRITSQLDKLPIDQQAAYAAFYKASAAALPRALVVNNRLTAENAALKEELEKYRSTDPGAEGHQGVAAAGAAAPRPKGIDGLLEVYEQAERR